MWPLRHMHQTDYIMPAVHVHLPNLACLVRQ